MRAVTKYLYFVAKRKPSSMYIGKHSFLFSYHHGRNSYNVVDTKNSCCTWASISIPLKSCYLPSIEFGQEREREFSVLKICLVYPWSGWIDFQRKASLLYVCYGTRLCVILFWRGYGLPASMSSPTSLGQSENVFLPWDRPDLTWADWLMFYLRSLFLFGMSPRRSSNLEHYLEIWRGGWRCFTDFSGRTKSEEQNIFF